MKWMILEGGKKMSADDEIIALNARVLADIHQLKYYQEQCERNGMMEQARKIDSEIYCRLQARKEVISEIEAREKKRKEEKRQRKLEEERERKSHGFFYRLFH